MHYEGFVYLQSTVLAAFWSLYAIAVYFFPGALKSFCVRHRVLVVGLEGAARLREAESQVS